MRIIYFGTGSFAIPTLKTLAEHVVLVVTQPDRPSGRGMKLHASPVKSLALELGIRVETPERARSREFVEQILQLHADALVVASYGQILSTAMLEAATRGGINLHGSILPRYRGAAPIQRSILERESETGITLMQMDRGMDTGDIIEIIKTPIGPDETYGELQDRLAEIAAGMASKWLPRICAGDYVRTPQNNELATTAPKVEKSEAELLFVRPALDEYYRFRAFTPAPGAYLSTNSGILRVSSARYSGLSGQTGTVLLTNPLTIAFSQGSLEFYEVQPEGKKRMSGNDYANGARLRPGSCLAI